MELVKIKEELVTLSLDDLFELADKLGKLKTGGILGDNVAEIRVNFSGSDYIAVKANRYNTLKENICDAIAKSSRLREFYRTQLS